MYFFLMNARILIVISLQKHRGIYEKCDQSGVQHENHYLLYIIL